MIVSLIINALAPSFGGEKNSAQAMKVAGTPASTPAWVAAAFRIPPILGSLLALLGALYGLYLLLGLPRLMKSPEDKTLGYTVSRCHRHDLRLRLSGGVFGGSHHRRWNAHIRSAGRTDKPRRAQLGNDLRQGQTALSASGKKARKEAGREQ